MQCKHVNMKQNLIGMFLISCAFQATKKQALPSITKELFSTKCQATSKPLQPAGMII